MNLKNISPEKIALRRKFPPTYGRRKSRSLTDSQKKLMQEFYPEIKLSPEDDGDIKKFLKDSKDKKVFFEIGFGDGEHLVHQVRENPEAIVIGCEPYLNSFVVCLQKIKKDDINNIRLYNNDSRYLLEKLPPNSIDKFYILFPDPWPKQRQFKRRIVTTHTVDLIYPLLKKGGVIRLATDIDSYFEQMLAVFASDKRFSPVTKEYTKIPSDHTETRYQQKAKEEGRLPRFLEYVKN